MYMYVHMHTKCDPMHLLLPSWSSHGLSRHSACFCLLSLCYLGLEVPSILPDSACQRLPVTKTDGNSSCLI